MTTTTMTETTKSDTHEVTVKLDLDAENVRQIIADTQAEVNELLLFGAELQAHKGTILNALRNQDVLFLAQKTQADEHLRRLYRQSPDAPAEAIAAAKNTIKDIKAKRVKLVRMITLFKGL